MKGAANRVALLLERQTSELGVFQPDLYEAVRDQTCPRLETAPGLGVHVRALRHKVRPEERQGCRDEAGARHSYPTEKVGVDKIGAVLGPFDLAFQADVKAPAGCVTNQL